MRDYIKCVVVNRFTLFSSIICICSIGSIAVIWGIDQFSSDPDTVSLRTLIIIITLFITGAISSFINDSTKLGQYTYSAYKRTKKHIQEHGEVNKKFSDIYMNSDYCHRRGFRLAIEEAGITELL